MALDITYSADFERVWKAWLKVPKPKTRNIKATAYKAWQSANNQMKFTPNDVDYIILNIEEQARYNRDWLKEQGKYIPAMIVTGKL